MEEKHMQKMICPNCNAQIENTSFQCSQCRTVFRQLCCPKCQSVLDLRSPVCTHCGTPYSLPYGNPYLQSASIPARGTAVSDPAASESAPEEENVDVGDEEKYDQTMVFGVVGVLAVLALLLFNLLNLPSFLRIISFIVAVGSIGYSVYNYRANKFSTVSWSGTVLPPVVKLLGKGVKKIVGFVRRLFSGVTQQDTASKFAPDQTMPALPAQNTGSVLDLSNTTGQLQDLYMPLGITEDPPKTVVENTATNDEPPTINFPGSTF